MERGSTNHASRVDDELADESAAMLHGSVLSGRDREDLEPEAPTADEAVTVPEPGGFDSDVPSDGPTHAAVLARSELARWLLPSAFPARAATLATVARKQGAPDEVVAPLDAMGTTAIFETVGELWVALGGTEEHRATAEELVPEPAPAASFSPVGAVTGPTDGDPANPDEHVSPADLVVRLVTLPPRVALAAARAFGDVLGRGLAAVTRS